MKLYSIHYKGDENNPKTFEGVTDNFPRWLLNHNIGRGALEENDPEWNEECSIVETPDNFEVEELNLSLYNKENINEK